MRLLTRDDSKQHKAAWRIFNDYEIAITNTVILETEWVLRYAYDFSAAQIGTALQKLFGLSNVRLLDPSWIAQALTWYQQGLDFADAMHLAQSQQCEKFYTFDKKFSVKARGLSDCSVELA